jgi:hypothetical protein
MIVNTGTFRKTAGTGTTLIGYGGTAVLLNNSGLVDAQSGTIQIDGGGTNTGTVNAATNASCNFTAAYVFNAGTLFTGAGINYVSGGTIGFSGNTTASNLQFNGATTVGTGLVTLVGTNYWSSGTLGAAVTISSGSTLNIITGSAHSLSGSVLTNNGTVNDTGGQIRGAGGWTIYNNGLWVEAVDNFFYNDSGGSPVDMIVNTGIFRKTAATGTTLIGYNGTAVLLNNSGLVDAQSGTIQINAGGTNSGTFNARVGADNNFASSYVFNNGSAFTGLGQNYLTGGISTFNGSITSSNLNWQSSVITGTLINSYGSTIYLTTGSTHDLPGAVLQNYGTVIHTGGRIRQGRGGLLDNEGLWLEQVDTDFNDSEYGGATATFLNNGTLNKNSTTGATTFDVGFPFNNNGMLEVLSGNVTFDGAYSQSGASLLFGVSNLTSYGSVNMAGAVSLNGTLGVDLLGGYVPVAGNSFTLLHSPSESGQFAGYNFPALPAGLEWAPSYNNGVTLNVFGSPTNDTLQISGTVTDTQGHPIVGANVAATLDPNSFTNLIQNGSFETPSDAGQPYVFYGIGSTNITGWTVFGPPGDNVDVTSYTWEGPAEDGLQFFDPTGNTGGAGIEQSFPTVSNQTYILSFYHGTYFPHGTSNALGVTLRSASFPNLVQNGSFEMPSDNGAQYLLYGIGSTNVTGWTVIGPAGKNIAIHNEYLGQAIDGSQWLDPTGGTGNAGVTQVLNTVSNQAYVLFFYHSSYALHGISNALGVTVGTNFYPFGETSGSGYNQWVQEQIPFTATGTSTVLTFQDLTGFDANDNFVDDVIVVPTNLAVLVTNIGTYTFGETAGTSGNLDWTLQRITFTAVSSSTTVAFRDLNNNDANNNFVDNVVIGPSDNGAVLGAVTDSNGHYQITVGSGTFQVDVIGLPGLGFNPVTNQAVTVSNSNGSANFEASPFSGQVYAISATVNPPGAGAIAGGGTFPQNSTVSLTATPVSVPPYVFVNWTENGYFQSATSNYSFTVTRARQLVANFTLPLYSLTASNNPPGAGTVAGQGSYYYGTTNTLAATPSFGYSFSNWTQGAVVLGTSPSLNVGIYSNTTVTANYTDANLSHTVTTVTSPPGLTLVAGAGVYTNGQTANFSAPLTVTNPPNYYYFSQYSLSNTVVSAGAAFAKTFSTLDPTNLQYVAVYTAQNILPLVRTVTVNFANPVPATTNLLLTLQFDRTMLTNPAPVILLTNSAPGAVQPVVPANSNWTTTVFTNDTYHAPPISIGAGMDGTVQMFVSGAQDLNTNTLALTNVAALTVVSTPPANPGLSIASSNSSSAVVGWSGYGAPVNLAGFRVFIENTNFTSVTGLPSVTTIGSGSRSFNFGGLALDTHYYVAVQAFDIAGNAIANVSTLPIFLPSTIPPPVSAQQTPVGSSAASLSRRSFVHARRA